MQEICLAFHLARDNAGSSNAASMAMIAMTTSSSISVNAFFRLGFIFYSDSNGYGCPVGLQWQVNFSINQAEGRECCSQRAG